MYAQNYKSVYSDKIAYFENQNGDVKCIRIDSVKFQSDSILFLFKNIQQLGPDCYTPFGASWLGNKIIVNDSINLFFNKNLDTIKIKINAKLNDKWLVYNYKDSIKIFATVIKIDTLTFLGLNDSVKTISFQVYNKAMDSLDYDLNKMIIILSQKYGFVKTLNFYLFPDFKDVSFKNESIEELTLGGLSVPQVGIKNLMWFDIHDFQIDDELHILYEFIDNGFGYSHSETKKTILKYLGRNDSKDSITYLIDRKLSTQIENDGAYNFAYIHDTIKSIIKQDTLFNKLPGESIITDHAYSYTMGSNNTKTEPAIFETIHKSFDSCWSTCCYDGCLPSYEYIKGLGGPYFQCDNAFSIGGENNALVYYKKGAKTWGTPLVVNEIKNLTIENKVDLFPNPANDLLTIKTSESILPYTLELFNLKGQSVLKTLISSSTYSLKLDENLKGIFFYRIMRNNELIKNGKLVLK